MTATCLFCASDGPFTTIEHIIPESLGNDDLSLEKQICNKCQNYFGKEVERYVLEKTPIGFWRVFLRIQTKSGKPPKSNLSQPDREKGTLPSRNRYHDDGVIFSAHSDDSISLEIQNEEMIRNIFNGSKNELRFVFTPKLLHMLGCFLCKVGIELVCTLDQNDARSDNFRSAREFARFGSFSGLWPIFHFSMGKIQDLLRHRREPSTTKETEYYSYVLVRCHEYLLFHFGIGTDHFIISLNDPYPTPVIRQAFPYADLQMIWYDYEEMRR
jgi:hypothetical protein